MPSTRTMIRPFVRMPFSRVSRVCRALNEGLTSLVAQNWTLFYALLTRNLEEMFPIIYTPTEADAIANYSHLFRRSEGLFLCPPGIDHMEEDFLEACGDRELELVNSSILVSILIATDCGLGCRSHSGHWGSGKFAPVQLADDQGSGGIGISAAKAVIYTLAAGVECVAPDSRAVHAEPRLSPSKALAVTLDVGTNNEELLKDELYIVRDQAIYRAIPNPSTRATRRSAYAGSHTTSLSTDLCPWFESTRAGLSSTLRTL